MGWWSSLFSSGVSSLVTSVGEVADEFNLSAEEKEQFKARAAELAQKRLSEMETTLRKEMEAKERVLVAELQQGDQFTKRARPTVVYAGLVFIVFNYCIVPSLQLIFGLTVTPFELPTAFWAGWSGIVSTWSIGRSLEKRGVKNKAVSLITGTASSLEASRYEDR